MEVVSDLSHFKKEEYPNLVVALGNFDGVHLGHLEILAAISKRAKKLNGTAAVFTFREHPQRVLHRKEDPPILTSLFHKLVLLDCSGLDLCFLIDFTLSFSREKPEDFVRKIFVETLGAREVCLGFNARFGHDRSGDSRLMRALAEKYDFEFLEAAPFEVEGQVVSSSLIRSLIQDGKLDKAAKFLGRPYSFFGSVILGSGRGRQLGFPTVNLDPHSEAMPPEGVYTAWVQVWDCRLVAKRNGLNQLDARQMGGRLKAVLNYGRRPTFGLDHQPIPEVHILESFKHENLANQTVEVIVGQRLRAERAFSNQESLRGQIQQDVEEAEKWFSNR
ncbi:MAG: riboflavin biosynthesis protein RibF [Candidatus Omnitrophica bacterium]|nr:riboflavin biosynthesis protein RibF [Candidatus Omnitrophota bacterium]